MYSAGKQLVKSLATNYFKSMEFIATPPCGRYTTIVIGSDGKRYDLGAGERLPWHEDERKRIYAVNAFVEGGQCYDSSCINWKR